MKVLVTGGAGFIGSHVGDRLCRDGHDVVVLDDLSRGRREHVPPAANFYQMELDTRWLDRLIAREKPDAVCHMAAQMDVRKSVADPLFDARVNIMGTLGLIIACRNHNVGRFLFASTGGAVYGDTDAIPTPEDTPTAPLSPYGASKLSIEHYLHLFNQMDGFSYAALRLANVYGPRQDPHGEAGVVAIFTEALLLGRQPTINGEGRQTRDYVYVDDVVDAFALALRANVNGAYNIGTGVETDVVELFGLIKTAAHSSIDALHGPAKAGEQARSCLQVDKAARDLGWTPKVPLADGIQHTVDWFRDRDG